MKTPRWVYLFLAVGLLAASQSGNIVRLGEAGPVAIAAWRLALATALLLPVTGPQLGLFGKLSFREMLLVPMAGTLLALHLLTWIYAVQLTTVVSAAIFFSINPLFTATLGHFIYGERVTPKLVLSIVLGIAGVTVIGLDHVGGSGRNLLGDAMALLCSVLFTAYFLVGKRIRRALPNRVYVTGLYGSAAVVSFAILAILGQPVVDYNARTWLCFALMAVVPTLIGHSSLNNALKYIDAGRISAATLSEPLLAGVVAYFAWGEGITARIAAGYALISASVLVLVLDRPAVEASFGERSG